MFVLCLPHFLICNGHKSRQTSPINNIENRPQSPGAKIVSILSQPCAVTMYWRLQFVSDKMAVIMSDKCASANGFTIDSFENQFIRNERPEKITQ